MSEEVEIEDYDLTADICNLSSAFNNLSEIDGELLSQGRKKKLARMKRLIFDAMMYYCECLPQIEEEEGKPDG